MKVLAGNVWMMFVTESEEDQKYLINKQKELKWRYRPSISSFSGDAFAPLQHPKGEPSAFAQ